MTNHLTIRPKRLERLRHICLALPESHEKEAWGDSTWRVRNRTSPCRRAFAGGRPSVWLKAPEGAQAALVDSGPDRFFVPPCVGHKGWVGVYMDGRRVDWEDVADLIEESYRLIAPKRLLEGLDGTGASPTIASAFRPSDRPVVSAF